MNEAPEIVFPTIAGSVLLTLNNVTNPFSVGVFNNISVGDPLFITVLELLTSNFGVGFTDTSTN